MIAAQAPPVPAARFAALPAGWRQFQLAYATNSQAIVTSWRYRWRPGGIRNSRPSRRLLTQAQRALDALRLPA